MADNSPILIGRDNSANPGAQTLLSRADTSTSTDPVFTVRTPVGGAGIHAEASGNSTGVQGTSDGGPGVDGRSTSGTGVGGISTSGYGVFGFSTESNGVRGEATGDFLGGVHGENTSSDGYGVFGFSPSGTGVGALSNSGTGLGARSQSGRGVQGISRFDDGVVGINQEATGDIPPSGVKGLSGPDGIGVTGLSGGPNPGVRGVSGNGIGVRGTSTRGAGVDGFSVSGHGVVGSTFDRANRDGGFFDGGITVVNGDENLKIDHPLDPQNKYLVHTSVESSEMKNVYDGLARLDEDGGAWVELPEWFEALNGDFRYQLTAVGGAAPNLHVAEEVSENRFKIAGGQEGMRICWQLTGTRKDPWAAANSIEVEQEKPQEERGRYLEPSLYDAPEEQRVMIGPPIPEAVEEEHRRLIDELRRLEDQRPEMEDLRRRMEEQQEEAPPEEST